MTHFVFELFRSDSSIVIVLYCTVPHCASNFIASFQGLQLAIHLCVQKDLDDPLGLIRNWTSFMGNMIRESMVELQVNDVFRKHVR